MQPLSAWVFLFIASSLADWTLNSPSGVSVDGDPVLQSPPEGNTINNYPVTNELPTSTTDGVINLAQVPLDQNNGLANMAAEPSTFEIANGCSPQQPGKKRRTRRDGEMCAPGDSLKNPNNNPSQLTDSHPKNPKTREAPSANASPRRYIPPLDPEAKQLLPLFLPKQSWPSEDDSVCREGGYRTPVCAPQSADDMGVSSSYDFVNFLDPCSPFSHIIGCLAGEKAWCCQTYQITLRSGSEDIWAYFRQYTMTREQIKQALNFNPNPFKFVGISCIPMTQANPSNYQPF